MKHNLEAGESLAHYSLLNLIDKGAYAETWVALDTRLSERVCLRIYNAQFEENTRTRIEDSIARYRGLIHPQVIRTIETVEIDEMSVVSQQYVRQGHPFEFSESFAASWPALKSLLETVQFAHELGFAHGMLQPSNLLLDDENRLYINGFGLPFEARTASEDRHYVSAEVQTGEKPDLADDIQSLGCLLYRALTGQDWIEGEFTTTVPLPADVRATLASMLASAPYLRIRNLGHVIDVLDAYALENVQPATAAFSRPTEHIVTVTETAKPLRGQRQLPTGLVLLGFAGLLVVAAMIFALLPRTPLTEVPAIQPAASIPASTPVPGDAAPQPAEPEATPMELAQIERAKEEGRDAATQIVRLQVSLEDIGVSLWARDRYEALLASAELGDSHYREERYLDALSVYEETIALLESLLGEADQALADSIIAGNNALASGDAIAAMTAFTIATTIDGEDESLQVRLARAENLGEVLSIVRSGLAAENNDELATAQELFERAVALDPLWDPASEGLNRVNQAISKRRFDDAMSTAFAGIAARDYDAARNSFASAAAIMPDSSEPDDGLLQIDLAIRADQIEQLKRTAEQQLESGAWQDAITTYESVQAMDSSLLFAGEGIATATERMALSDSLQRFLLDPGLMLEDKELTAARRAVVEASSHAAEVPHLADSIMRLNQLVANARVPISVTINSDNRTDITIYRISSLGKIRSTDLSLYPGNYTIVGKRPGYRDVQQELRLLVGEPVDPLFISCTEKI